MRLGVSRAPVYTRACLAVLGFFNLAGAPLGAHEIPPTVAVHAFLVPEDTKLRLLLRVPMAALRDVDHARGAKGEMNLSRIQAPLRNATRLWIVGSLVLFENDARLPDPAVAAVQVSLPSDRSFATYEEALAHVAGPPLPADTELVWNQGMLDVLLEYGIRSDRSRFAIHPGFTRFGSRVVTVLRFRPPGGTESTFELGGDPGLVRLDPRWSQAALLFVRMGFLHILEGADHLLFLFCLVIPFRRLRPLVLVVTAFTVAHSITLVAAAFGLGPSGSWFPPFIEVLIAASIVYMALENILVTRPRVRWLIPFAFGLVHGFGFSFALRETLQFAGSHLLTSLLAFNLGVELGQLLVLAVLVPVLGLLFRLVGSDRTLTIVLSALAAHSGWHWLTERLEALRQFPWPELQAADLLAIVRWLIVLVLGVAILWYGRRFLVRPQGRAAGEAADLGPKA